MRILYLDLDSTRPDHLGCYGYQRDTSPNIDRIAAQGVRFDNVHCSDAPCLPSRTAFMSGQFGIRSGVVGHGGTAADPRLEGAERQFGDRHRHDNFPSFLRTCGLRTSLISPFGERHAAWSFYAGFQEMHNTGLGGMESAEQVTPTVLDWIDRRATDENWYLHVNYWDPHTPYRAPAELGNPFADAPLPAWLTEETLAEHWTHGGPHTAQDVGMYHNRENVRFPRAPGEVKGLAGLRRLIDGYDCGVRHMDNHLGQIFNALADANVLDDTVVIISADHGENLGELGIYAEHGTADKGTCNVPLIVRWPGAGSAATDAGLHYHFDLAPTVAEMLDAEPRESWDGQSYAATLTDGADCGRDYLVISQCAHVCQRSVRFGPWLYMRTYHDGYHSAFERDMLFNVETDPHEQHDLAAEHPELCQRGVYLLHEWHEGMMRKNPDGVDPMWTVMHEHGPYHAMPRLVRDSGYLQRLRDTGREAALAVLLQRHPGLGDL